MSAPVIAASLSLSPVGLDLLSNQKAASISLTNNGSQPVSLQVRIFKWSQIDGKDVLEPTRNVLASPPAATVPAGATYTIRVARVGPVPTGSESYRLFIDELPKAVDPRAAPQAVSMVLRTSLPVFFTPKEAVARLTWTVWQDSSGTHLRGTNNGQRYVKLADLAVETPAGRLSFGTQLAGYILPGATRQFDLPVDGNTGPVPTLAGGAKVTVTAKAGKFDVRDEAVVQAP